MSSLGRKTFLGGLAILGFLVPLFGGIWFFTRAPHRDTTMQLPYARHGVPAVSVARQFAKSDVILVAGGCGAGFHRGAYGYCVPNRPMVGPPVVVGPSVCPPGYYLGPRGRRCWPMGGGPPPPAYGPPTPGEGPSAGYGPPPRGYPRTSPPTKDSPPPGPPSPSAGPETGPPPGDGPSAGYAPPPRRGVRPPPPDQNSPPPGPPSPSAGPETGPPPNE